MKFKDILEGRHPHDQYYRPKPKSEFKPKPRPKRTLWYSEDQYPNWVTDIRYRFPDAEAFYDEEMEEIIAATPDMQKAYGKWSKKAKGMHKGFSLERPRPMHTVTHSSRRLRKVKENENHNMETEMKKITFKESLVDEAYNPDEQRVIQQYAGDERRSGGERRSDSGVNQFLDAMSNHMHQVRKALSAGQYDIAAKLVNSAISSLEKNRV